MVGWSELGEIVRINVMFRSNCDGGILGEGMDVPRTSSTALYATFFQTFFKPFQHV